jgi:branched-chain amino acid aminotransferase
MVPQETATVPVLDRGFLYGDAIFETVAAYGGTIFRLDQHLDRFMRSAELLGIEPPVDRDGITGMLYECLARNAMADAVLRFSASRGRSERGLDASACVDPTFLILCFAPRVHPAEMLEQGAHVTVSSVRRTPAAALSPLAKTANFVNNILAYNEATARGAHEAVMLNMDGALAEGTVSNLFVVRGGEVRTPSLACGIMAGITRAAAIEAASHEGIGVHEAVLSVDEFHTADEAFYTNTTVTIMPIGRVDEWCLPAPGPVTLRLRRALRDMIEREAGACWAPACP